MRASMVISLKRNLNLVMNIPAAEKARSASTEVGGRVFIAQNTFSRIAGRSLVFSKLVSSLFILDRMSAWEDNFSFPTLSCYLVLLNLENLFVFERVYSRLIFIRFFFSANSHFFNDEIVLTLSMVTQCCGNRLLKNLQALLVPRLPFIAAGAMLKMFPNFWGALLCNPSTHTHLGCIRNWLHLR